MKHSTAFVGICFGIALLIVGGVFLLFHKKAAGESKDAYKTEFFAMDTLCEMTLYGSDDTQDCRMLIERLGKELDRYDEQSEVYKFNTSGSTAFTGNTALLFDKCGKLYHKYGLVDVTCGGLISLWGITSDSPSVPSDEAIKAELEKVGFDKLSQSGSTVYSPLGAKLDFGAVAKGYALDKAAELLDEKGIGCAVISLGSSTLLYGEKPDGEAFKMGVKDPFSPDELILTFECGEGFVSTSGGYERFFEAGGERYIHILDLSTGRPCNSGLASVTVIAKSGAESDFLSTAIFIDGKDKLDKYLADESIQVIAIDEDKNIYYSPSLSEKINLSGNESGGR
ncbi:MAG: FAD:protein FMN transferase [Ruminococcus sp.]|nr:FAD:protein FMN transferase [Ruminococcus sp.]